MENIEEQHCRLCLNVISDDQFEEIEEATRNIFDIILLNLDFDNSNKHIICNDCSLQVREAYEFKSMCLYTDNTIIPHVDYETGCSVDLREIYVKETENKQLMNTFNDDHKVCRLCMQLTSSEFMSVHKLEVDMIEKYIPEINFSVIKDPIICKRCFISFSTHSGFIQKCFKIKENVMSVHGTKVTASKGWTSSLVSPVKVEEIRIKSELNEQENEFIEIGSTALKSEDKEMLIKTESIDIKAEENDKESCKMPAKCCILYCKRQRDDPDCLHLNFFQEKRLESVPSKTVGEKLWQKSITSIDLDTIDYKDEFLVRKLLEKSKMEIIQLRKSRRLQTLKLYRANKKIKGVGGLLSHVKEKDSY